MLPIVIRNAILYIIFIQPTGKQLFLSNRAGQEDAIIAQGEEEIIEDENIDFEVAIEEDLFIDDVDDIDNEELQSASNEDA